MLIGGIPRRVRLHDLGHPLFGVAQDLLGGAPAVALGLRGPLLGQRHRTSGHLSFRYLGHVRGYPQRPIGNRRQ